MEYLILPIIVSLYLLPTIIAAIRRHKNQAPIAIINIIFGWTFLGWIIALIWSATDNTEKVEVKQ
jgi:hypothetical protein